MEKNGLNQVDWDSPIYRIYSMNYFIELLKTNTNVLVSPSLWDDPFENFLLKCRVQTSEGEKGSLEPLYKSWYAQCWSLTEENDAMWRIYSADTCGVKVKTTPRKLLQTLWNQEEPSLARLSCFIGRVDYYEKANIIDFLNHTTLFENVFGGDNRRLADLLCVKRTEFRHEDEIRLIYSYNGEDTFESKLVSVPFDASEIFEEVVLDPRLKDDEFNKNSETIRTAGWCGKISKSTLYDMPVITIGIG